MQITLKLHGILRGYHPSSLTNGVSELSLDEGSTVRSVVEQLGIPADALYLAFINKQQAVLHTPLQEKDTLWLFPPVAGG